MSPLSLFVVIFASLVFCCHGQFRRRNYDPGTEPLNLLDAFTQYFFDPPSWIRKFHNVEALNAYAREKALYPLYPYRRTPFRENGVTTRSDPARYVYATEIANHEMDPMKI